MADTVKQVAELHIIRYPGGTDAFHLAVGGTLVWNTRAAPTAAGRAAAKERLRTWLASRGNPYRVEMVGTAPALVEEPAANDPEAQFWWEFGPALGGQEWADVETLLKRRVKKPATLADWHKLAKVVGDALRDEARAVA